MKRLTRLELEDISKTEYFEDEAEQFIEELGIQKYINENRARAIRDKLACRLALERIRETEDNLMFLTIIFRKHLVRVRYGRNERE